MTPNTPSHNEEEILRDFEEKFKAMFDCVENFAGISERSAVKDFLITAFSTLRHSIESEVRNKIIKYVKEVVNNPKSENYIYAETIPLSKIDEILNSLTTPVKPLQD